MLGTQGEGFVVKVHSRLVAGLTAVVVLLAAGAFVGFRLLIDQVDRAIPQADLFGIGSPSPTSSAPATSTPQPDNSAARGRRHQGPAEHPDRR